MLARLVQGSPGRQHNELSIAVHFPKWCACLIVFVVALVCTSQVEAQSTRSNSNIRSTLRIAWGGAVQEKWQGSASLSAGTLKLVNLLGMEPDQSRAVQQVDRKIQIDHLKPRIYDGFDLEIDAPADATLTLSLAIQGSQEVPISIPIATLMQQPFQANLNQQGARLLVQRAPGDTLRTEFQRDHLVFSPGENFRITCSGYRTSLAPGSTIQVDFRLQPARSGNVVWQETIKAEVGDDGNVVLEAPIDVEIPEEEGVYDLDFTLTQQRLASLVFASKPTHQRRLQFVVIDSSIETATEPEPLRQVASFDPSRPDWWSRLSKLSSYYPWQSATASELHNGKTSTFTHQERQWQQLAPGGWHAYPLPIEAIGQPLVVEVEYPGDVLQSLGISIIEPDASGAVTPVGIDSGLEVSQILETEEKQANVHRLVFWPRTSTPMLLLSSRGNEQPATFGRITILAGTPSFEDPKAVRSIPDDSSAPSADDRLAIAYWQKPLFTRGFGAPEDINPASNRSLEDWLTFLEGSNRVVDHLKRVGFNAACISVMDDGGTLYPSPHFRSTPKFDKGLFFDDGRDPFKKDVVELLFRQFDRAELRLIPAMDLRAPLAQLEARRVRATDSSFLAPVNHQGKVAPLFQTADGGDSPYYNPLNEDVQQSISDLVLDFVSRYGHHPSFSGLSLHLDSNGYGILPGPEWGMDEETLLRFSSTLPNELQQTFANLPAEPQVRRDWVLREQWATWLKWRARRMFQLHARLATILRSANSKAVLYLDTSGCFHGTHAKQLLVPQLPVAVKADEVLLELGIDPELYKTHPNISLVETNFVRPEGSEKRADWYRHYQAAQEGQVSYADEDNRTVFHFHVPDTLHVAEFDQRKPFGKDGNYTWLASQFVGAGAEARRPMVEHLANEDDLTIMFGGWMVPTGQDKALYEFLSVYKELPRGNYHRLDVPQSQPLVIRKLTTGNETTIYMVNPTPWALNAVLTVQLPSDGIVTPLASSQISRGQQPKGTGQWSITIPAYGLIAAKVDVFDVAITGAKVYLPTGVMRQLREDLDQLALRVRSIRYLKPIDVLQNPDFEVPAEDQIPGWVHGSQPGTEVKLNAQKFMHGNRSLGIESQGEVAWARSEEFEIPASRRMMIKMHLLSEPSGLPTSQPRLGMVLDGYIGNQNYYKPALLGEGTDFALQPSWSEFAYPIYDLPPDLKRAKIGLDLMGPGKVLMDKVEIYDVAFRESELNQLNKLVTLAYAKYQQAEVGDCHRLLNSYWAKFLEGHVPVAPALAKQMEEARTASRQQRIQKEDPETKGWFDTIRSYTPKFPRFR